MIDFEFDPKKSKNNLSKHGIDFTEAKALWTDLDLIEIPAKVVGEPRYMVIGRINKKHWSGVITYRGKLIRIISVRQSSQWEVSIYESIKDASNKG
jgi:uncharacterized DUF497 family protein